MANDDDNLDHPFGTDEDDDAADDSVAILKKVRAKRKAAGTEGPPIFSDEALALRFAEIHTDNLRYVAAWNKWLSWDDTRWSFDTTLSAWNEARKICRAASAECNKLKLAAALASSKTVAAVISLARSDRRLAATVDQWNTDIWSLNTPNGVIDLRTGKMREHDPTDYMTKITTVAPDHKCSIPIWLAFLERVTGGDVELVDFLQRMSGYALTGSTQEHALFFHHGVGANGKTTFINVLTGIIGDYHKTAPIETFIATHNEQHPTDLAGLHGARLVTAVETEEGRRWAENKIKALTGGDQISARFMRQDFFEFMPMFNCSLPATTSRAFAASTRPSAAGCTSSLGTWSSRPTSATRSSARNYVPNGPVSSPGCSTAACSGSRPGWHRQSP